MNAIRSNMFTLHALALFCRYTPSDGAILAMGTVFAHNLMRQLDVFWPNKIVTDKNLLLSARLATIPLTLAAALIAGYYRSDHPSGATGYLLIVAFDVVLATVTVPLFGCFYAKVPRPNAALLSILAGATVRIILEFTLPKDGFLLLPYDAPEFLDVGPAASAKMPTFMDHNASSSSDDLVWDPDVEVCDQPQFEDYTGVDSLAAFLTSLLVFLLVQTLEHHLGRPLFTIPGMRGYDKNDVGSSFDENNNTANFNTVVRDDKGVVLKMMGSSVLGGLFLHGDKTRNSGKNEVSDGTHHYINDDDTVKNALGRAPDEIAEGDEEGTPE
jgi:hypothetical protein